MTRRTEFLAELTSRFGPVQQLPGSRSLFRVAGGLIVYVRYSRLHARGSTFYGLRESDLRQLQGLVAAVAFLWDGQEEPLLVPLDEFSSVLDQAQPAADGQIKAQVLIGSETELYIARAGRHNVEPYLGWWWLEQGADGAEQSIPSLSHAQVQTLLGAIGQIRGLHVWIPAHDRSALDWSLVPSFEVRRELPVENHGGLLNEIDVIWFRPGSYEIESLFEVEHSTPIYSGLLRLNDVRVSGLKAHRFAIVSDVERRDGFVRQLQRPTFRVSGLSEVCGFMPYTDVYLWHRRLRSA